MKIKLMVLDRTQTIDLLAYALSEHGIDVDFPLTSVSQTVDGDFEFEFEAGKKK